MPNKRLIHKNRRRLYTVTYLWTRITHSSRTTSGNTSRLNLNHLREYLLFELALVCNRLRASTSLFSYSNCVRTCSFEQLACSDCRICQVGLGQPRLVGWALEAIFDHSPQDKHDVCSGVTIGTRAPGQISKSSTPSIHFPALSPFPLPSSPCHPPLFSTTFFPFVPSPPPYNG